MKKKDYIEKAESLGIETDGKTVSELKEAIEATEPKKANENQKPKQGESEGKFYPHKKLIPGNKFQYAGVNYVVLSNTVVRNQKTGELLQIA